MQATQGRRCYYFGFQAILTVVSIKVAGQALISAFSN
jgi:hypothetical protein